MNMIPNEPGAEPRATRRERMEARADRRREWAGIRAAKAEQTIAAGNAIGEHIPMGQPILVGHHSEGRARRDQTRMQNLASKTVEHVNMRDRHESRAQGIDRQLATSIFSDDHDALEQLDAKIAKLEARRDGIKAYNKTARAGTPDPSLMGLTLEQLAEKLRYVPGGSEHMLMPSYTTTNLGANIRRLKRRRAQIAEARS